MEGNFTSFGAIIAQNLHSAVTELLGHGGVLYLGVKLSIVDPHVTEGFET